MPRSGDPVPGARNGRIGMPHARPAYPEIPSSRSERGSEIPALAATLRAAGQATVTSPSRHRAGRSSTGQPAGRSRGHRAAASAAGGRRSAYGAARLPARRRARASSVVHRLARHVVVDQRLRQPLGQRRRGVQGGQPGGQGQRPGAGRRRAHPGGRAGPARRRSPRRAARPGRARRSSSAQAAGTSDSSYCRSTLNARTSTGRSPASSNPPRRERQPGRIGGRRRGGDPRRVDLQPDHAYVRPDAAASRARSSTVVTGVAP